MELAFERKTAEYWQPIAHETLAQEETAELIVPESMPDIQRIVDSWAQVHLRSKECRSGGMSVTGAIQAGLLFLAEGELVPRQLECYIPFTVRLERPELSADSFGEYAGFVRRVDARMISSRKAMLRVNLLSELELWQKKALSVPVLAGRDEDLQVLEREYPILRTLDLAERPFLLQEETEIPTALPAAEQILSWSLQPRVQEKKAVGGSIAFRGVMELCMLYLSEDERLCSWSTEIPFAQYAQMNQNFDEAEAEVLLAITGRELELGENHRRLALQANLLAQCRLGVVQTMRLVEDLYSTAQTVVAQYEQLEMTAQLDARTLSQTLRETIPASCTEVEYARAYPDRPELTRQEGSIEIKIPIELQLLCRDEAGSLSAYTGRIAAEFSLDAAENCTCRVLANVFDVFAAPAAGGAEVRCTVQAQAAFSSVQEFSCVGAAESWERKGNPERPSLIIRRMVDGESLWEIAKANSTTVAQLCSANGVKEEEAATGMLLLIPMQ